MGSKERRQRHHARIRQAILAAARDLFVAEGVREVSLRQIADRIEYSAAAVYTYFQSKDDIFLALAEEDAAVLQRRVHDATGHVVDPLVRTRRALWTLYEFLSGNPLFLELMIRDNSVARSKAGRLWFDCFRRVAARVEADIDQCIQRGQLSMTLSAGATRQLLWVGMLGAATVARRIARDEDFDAVADDLLETLIAGLLRPVQARG